MKESEAWKILAEEHDAKRTAAEFLCVSLDDFSVRNRPPLASIPSELRKRMQQRIHLALVGRYTAYTDMECSAPDVRDARVLACLMFSEQAKEEER